MNDVVSHLPTVNASLNSIALVLLLLGYSRIRSKRVTEHRRYMLAAFVVSAMFLVSYVTYHLVGEERRFGGQGWIRPVYYVLLISHVILAATVPVLASRTLYLALRGRLNEHRRAARITLPIWIYVSVTGVMVYLFLLWSPAQTFDGGSPAASADQALNRTPGASPETRVVGAAYMTTYRWLGTAAPAPGNGAE